MLEGQLDAQSALLTDQELIDVANEHPEAFETRSARVLGPQYWDQLPGRAPTRALYRVRCFDLNGEASVYSELTGPVRVPDMRRPPAPNLFRACPSEAPDPQNPMENMALERRIAVEWSQAGPMDGVGFVVRIQNPAPRDPSESVDWQTFAEYAPGALMPVQASTYRIELHDQVPGRPVKVDVTAVRHAPDPIDKSGRLRRRIESVPSEQLTATALGSLRPPTGLMAAVDADRKGVRLTWVNGDSYQALEVRVREPGRYGVRKPEVIGGGLHSKDVKHLEQAGFWSFQLRAIGCSSHVFSEEITVEIGERA